MKNPFKRTAASAYEESRHALVSRRAVMKYGIASGAGLALAACGADDSVLTDARVGVTPSTNETLPAASAPTTESPEPTETPSPETLPPETTATTAPALSQAVPDGNELIVGFTYEQAAGGKNLAPYTAVWIEDTEGALVHTIALWRQQDDKGRKYLRDLTRWFSVDQAGTSTGEPAAEVISGPTRLPGRYAVAWDGQLGDADALVRGTYFVCIESSREDGPHSLIRELVTLDGASFELGLTANSELIDALVSIR